MSIEFVDMDELAKNHKKRKVVMNTPRFHAWFHYYPNPGDIDDMHCHNADQTFYVIDGECTMHFPDGSNKVLKPRMAALITGGSFYQLENSGKGPMVMMGNRSGSTEEVKIIDYKTRKPVPSNLRSSRSER